MPVPEYQGILCVISESKHRVRYSCRHDRKVNLAARSLSLAHVLHAFVLSSLNKKLNVVLPFFVCSLSTLHMNDELVPETLRDATVLYPCSFTNFNVLSDGCSLAAFCDISMIACDDLDIIAALQHEFLSNPQFFGDERHESRYLCSSVSTCLLCDSFYVNVVGAFGKICNFCAESCFSNVL